MKQLTLVVVLLSIFAGAFGAAAPLATEGFGGVWVLNRDRGDAPGVPNSPDASEPEGGRSGGGRLGGRGGRGGRGGEFGRGGRDGSGSENAAARRQAMANYMRESMEASKQLTVVVREGSITITDADGHVLALKTDGKKTEERTGNGLLKLSRRAYWDGDKLVHEVEIERGAKIVRSYELSPGGTQLQLTTKVENARGRPMSLLRVYERPVDSVSR
jgi:hypothetical protein